jgi:hypothetical protein
VRANFAGQVAALSKNEACCCGLNDGTERNQQIVLASQLRLAR